jgi:hypothetical protein
MGFKFLRERGFKTNLAIPAIANIVKGKNAKPAKAVNDNDPNSFVEISDLKSESVQIHFTHPTNVSTVVLKELIRDGQSVENFYVQVRSNDKLESFEATTIGHKRIISFPVREADDIFIYFLGAKRRIKIAEVEVY